MGAREDLVKSEAKRARDYEASKKDVLAELDGERFVEVRRIEQAQRDKEALVARLAQAAEADRGARAAFGRALEESVPPEFRTLLMKASSELSVSRNIASESDEGIDRLRAIRAWAEQAENAKRDPAVTTNDIEALIRRGQMLVGNVGLLADRL